MNALELIETGIIEGDWGLVCEGYLSLTGKLIPIPPGNIARDGLEDGMRRISDIVNRTLAESTPTLPTSKKTAKKTGVGRKKKVKKSKSETKDGEDNSLILDDSQRTPTKFAQEKTGESQFITNEPDIDEIKRNEAKARRTQKTRRATPKKYQAECSECSNKFESDRPTGEIGQKCRSCLRGGKGKFSG